MRAVLGPRAEGFHDAAIARGNAHQRNASRAAEGHGRAAGQGRAHHVTENRCRIAAAGFVFAEAPRFIKADPNRDNDIRREADEPIILVIIRGAGLAGNRAAKARPYGAGAGAALHNTFQDAHHLIGGNRVCRTLPFAHFKAWRPRFRA